MDGYISGTAGKPQNIEFRPIYTISVVRILTVLDRLDISQLSKEIKKLIYKMESYNHPESIKSQESPPVPSPLRYLIVMPLF